MHYSYDIICDPVASGWATGPLRKGFVGFGILSDQTDQTTGQTIRLLEIVVPNMAERKKDPGGSPRYVIHWHVSSPARAALRCWYVRLCRRWSGAPTVPQNWRPAPSKSWPGSARCLFAVLCVSCVFVCMPMFMLLLFILFGGVQPQADVEGHVGVVRVHVQPEVLARADPQKGGRRRCLILGKIEKECALMLRI